MIQVRFHLGKGEHFRHWQIKRGKSQIEYVSPYTHSLELIDCRLKNYPLVADRIYSGETNKDVCAWVECEIANIFHNCKLVKDDSNANAVLYDPRVLPFWRNNDGVDIDGSRFVRLVSQGRRLYVQD